MARRRQRGTGAISHRRDGLWVGEISLGIGDDGKRDRRSFSSHIREDVEFWLREQQYRSPHAPDSGRVTVDGYLDRWLAGVGPTVRAATARGYGVHVHKWISPVIGSLAIGRLDPADIRRVPAYVVRHGRSPRTAGSVLQTLRMALNQAVRDGYIRRNVASGVKAPRSTSKPVTAMSPEDARAILAAFKGHRLEPLVTVAIGTGLRQGELLGLRWADINGSRIRVTGSVRPVPRADGTGYVVTRSSEAKTRGSIRAIEAPAFVVEALADERRRQVAENLISPYVFVTRGRRGNEGKPMFHDGVNVTRSFQRQLEAKGLPDMRWHDLRHAYATLMLSAGVPLKVIQEALGHSSIATTAGIYAHVLPSLSRDAAAKLEEAMRG